MNESKRPIVEEVKLKGGQVLDKIRDIVEQGNARRVIIKNHDRVLLEFPLSVGVGGATAALLIAPQLAAIGAIAALLTDVSILVERDEDEVNPPSTGTSPSSGVQSFPPPSPTPGTAFGSAPEPGSKPPTMGGDPS